MVGVEGKRYVWQQQERASFFKPEGHRAGGKRNLACLYHAEAFLTYPLN